MKLNVHKHITQDSNIFFTNLFDLIKKIQEQEDFYKCIAIDIETESLRVTQAGIYSISFCGFLKETQEYFCEALLVDNNSKILVRLRKLFEYLRLKNIKPIFHKANYDVPVLIYNLFMNKVLGSYDELNYGLNVFENIEDTLIMAYLCYNSCSRPSLSLKDLGKELVGYNWKLQATEITNVRKVNTEQLLQYNNEDTLATCLLYFELSEKLKKEDQEFLYKHFFRYVLLNNIKMQLIGMPIDMEQVINLEKELLEIQEKSKNIILNAFCTKRSVYALSHEAMHKYNTTRKVKRKTLKESKVEFNIGSVKHLQNLFYEILNLPQISTTDKGGLSTSSGTIDKFLSNDNISEYTKNILSQIQLYSKTSKILNTFIPAFKDCDKDKYGNHTLLGYFNLGGTVSGRLSSSNINLQQLPSTGTIYAKAVKKCFKAPKGWLFIGVDYSSLEDRISALLTKDINKLRVYTDGYDGHCLRAYAYFKDRMPDIKLAEPTDKCYLDPEIGNIYTQSNLPKEAQIC